MLFSVASSELIILTTGRRPNWGPLELIGSAFEYVGIGEGSLSLGEFVNEPFHSAREVIELAIARAAADGRETVRMIDFLRAASSLLGNRIAFVDQDRLAQILAVAEDWVDEAPVVVPDSLGPARFAVTVLFSDGTVNMENVYSDRPQASRIANGLARRYALSRRYDDATDSGYTMFVFPDVPHGALPTDIAIVEIPPA